MIALAVLVVMIATAFVLGRANRAKVARNRIIALVVSGGYGLLLLSNRGCEDQAIYIITAIECFKEESSRKVLTSTTVLTMCYGVFLGVVLDLVLAQLPRAKRI